MKRTNKKNTQQNRIKRENEIYSSRWLFVRYTVVNIVLAVCRIEYTDWSEI